jgi:hypothetical protein
MPTKVKAPVDSEVAELERQGFVDATPPMSNPLPNVGDSLVGQFVGRGRDFNGGRNGPVPMYKVDVGGNEGPHIIQLMGSAKITQAFDDMPVGSEVFVKFLGKVDTEGGKMNDYKILYKAPKPSAVRSA